jgi:hypothetical protein
MHFWTFALLRTFCILYHVLTQEEIESYKLSLKDEKHRFPGDPRKHVGNCGRFGASPGGRPYKFCGGRPGDLLERFLPNCGPSARRPGAGMQQPCAGAAARDAGAAARAPPSGTPAASGCAAFAGGVVLPAPGASVPRFHTGAQGRRRPATCMCALRPLRACARARSAPGHGRRRGTHTPRRRSSRSRPRAADAVCAREAGRPSRVLSLSHTHSLLPG